MVLEAWCLFVCLFVVKRWKVEREGLEENELMKIQNSGVDFLMQKQQPWHPDQPVVK